MKVFNAAFRGMLRAGRIICVSEHAKRELLVEADYPPDRIAVIHHGVDPAFRPIPKAESRWLREKLLQPGERFLLLHVGHSAPRKNVETLYRVVTILRQNGWAVRLVRIGRPPTAAQAELIKELGVAPFITHLSTLPNQELPTYFAAADVFVFPSLYEGFGLPLIEAMACATPVVCSDWGLFHEVCYDAAIYANPRSPEALARAITDALDNQTLVADIRERALSRARKFTWDRAAQQVLDVYNSLYENRHVSQRV